MSRRLAELLGLVLISACGATTPAPAPEHRTETPKRAPYADELEHAESLRAEAEALEPPEPGKIADDSAAIAFMKEPVRAWVAQRRSAVDRASTAYADLIPRLPKADRARAALATGDMQVSFAADFERVSFAATPPKVATQPALLAAYRRAIHRVTEPQLTKALSAFELCIAVAAEAGVAETAAVCRARLALLPRADVAAPALRPATPRPTVADASRPHLPTRQTKPCVFAGTLKLWRAPLALAGQGPIVAHFNYLELEKLDLPARAGDPFRLFTIWPVRGTFSLAHDTLPFDLRSRVELVQGHIWLSAGAAVSAVAARAGHATATRSLSADEGLRSSPEATQVVACSALELAGRRPTWSDAPKGAKLTFLGDVPLSAAPNGAAVGLLRLRDAFVVRVIERRSGWTRIAAESTTVRGLGQVIPYDFDAWTKATPSDEPVLSMLGLLDSRSPPTHVTTTDMDLFGALGSKPLGKLVSGVSILAGETRDGFVEVSVPGLQPSEAKQWGLWVSEPSFRSGTRAL